MYYKNNIFFLPIFIIFFAFFWSLFLLNEWGTDYGGYYAIARFLDEDYRLYKEAFDHKGPIYYIFLKCIGSLIGWGSKQAFVSLGITVSIYLLTIFYIAKNYTKNNLVLLMITGLSFATLLQQPSNISISLFQFSLLLMFFFSLNQSHKKGGKRYILISVILLCLSILTRIDSIIYIILFFPLIIQNWNNKNSLKKIGIALISGSIFSLLIVYTIFICMDFSFNDFYIHNIKFNEWYKLTQSSKYSILAVFYRPEHLKLMILNGLLPLSVFILNQMIYKKEKNNIKDIIAKIMDPNNFSIFVLIISIAGWLYIASDKNYHIVMLTTGVIYFIISNIHLVEKMLLKNYSFLTIYISIICLYSLQPSIETITKKNNLFDPFDEYSDTKRYEETIKDMADKSSVHIIGGRGWTYLFSNTKPKAAINDWWLYYKKETFTTEYLLKNHYLLINNKNGYEFWVDNHLLDTNNTSKFFKEIINTSVPINSDGYYTKFIIKK